MRNKILLLCLTTLTTLCQCKKDKSQEYIQLDSPFYASIGQQYILKEDRQHNPNGNLVRHFLFITCTDVEDRRCFVGEGLSGCCPSSTGGLAIASTIIREDNASDSTILPYMPGCTNGQEWDTVNSYAPYYIYHSYKIYLLKIDPWENKAASKDDYRIKYVIKKN